MQALPISYFHKHVCEFHAYLHLFLHFVPRCLFTDEKLRDNFRIERNSDTQNIAYDYDSIMHYDAYAFSSNDQPTIQPVDETIPLTRIGQRNALSERDKRHIQQLYCKGNAKNVHGVTLLQLYKCRQFMYVQST